MKKAILYQNEECVIIRNISIANNNYAFFVQVLSKKIIYLKENVIRGNVTYASLDKLVNLFPQYQTPGIFNAKVMLDTFVNTINYKIRNGSITESDDILELISQFERIINDPYIKQKTSPTERNIFSNEAMREVTDTIKKLDAKYKKVSLTELLHTKEESVNDVFLSQNWLDEDVTDNKKLVYESIEKSNKMHKRSPIDFLFNNKVLNIHMIIIVIAAVGFASCLELLSNWKKTGSDVSTQIDELREVGLVDNPSSGDVELPNDVPDPTSNQVSNSNKKSNKTSNKNNKSNKTSNKNANACVTRWGAKYCQYTGIKMLNVDFNALKRKNKDIVGWIYVNNTQVNYPFVQTGDNEHYLNYDIDNKSNIAGWIFADYRSDLKNFSKRNTILYGHGRTDNVMFGSLNGLSKDWMKTKNNQIIKISTPTRDTLWQIVSIYEIKQETYYLSVNFENDKAYQKWINTMVKRSKYNFGLSPTVNDKFLTLSTCYDFNGKRTVIHAVLVKNVKKK